MNKDIRIIEKPDWVSWDEIHEVLWISHEKNRTRGINMALPSLPGEKIKEKVEKGNGKMFVAIQNGKLIATAAVLVKMINLWCYKGDCAYLCFASILPEYTGKGLYKSLYKYIERESISMSMKGIMFDTHEKNTRMLEINSRNGFKKVDLKICKDHYNIMMMKWLGKCTYSDAYCKSMFYIRKIYKKLRYKPGRVKRFGI